MAVYVFQNSKNCDIEFEPTYSELEEGLAEVLFYYFFKKKFPLQKEEICSQLKKMLRSSEWTDELEKEYHEDLKEYFYYKVIRNE